MDISKHFKGMELMHVPWKENQEADEIAKGASRRESQTADIFEERLTKMSVKQPKEVATASTDEELPLRPARRAPTCSPFSGHCLLLALTH